MSSRKPSLREQLMGAAIGTAVALGAYGAYVVGAPVVQGLLAQVSASAPEESKFTESDRETRQEEIAARTKEILGRLRRGER